MKTKSLLAVLTFLLTICFSAKADEVQNGKAIFLSRCAACHNVNKTLTGPALAGVMDRHTLDWIVNFVHSSQTLVKSGDSSAVRLYTQFSRVVMPDHSDLTEENIKSLLAYIKSETGISTGAPFSKPVKMIKAYKLITLNDYALIISYLLVVAALTAVLYFAVVLNKFQLQRKATSQSDKI